MLTAIVVGIATTALALALVVRINEDYGTTEEELVDLMRRCHDSAFASIDGGDTADRSAILPVA